MMRQWKITSILLAVALTVTACGAGAGGAGGGTANNGGTANSGGTANGTTTNGGSTGVQMQSLPTGQGDHTPAVVPYVTQGGEKYISVDEIVKVLQYENDETDGGNVREIGDKDVLIRLEAGSVDAEKEGTPFTLSDAPKIVNGNMMLSAAAAADLFADEMVFDVGQDGFHIYPSDTGVMGRDTDDAADSETVDPSLDFADDPNDPFKGEETEGVFNGTEEGELELDALEVLGEADREAIPALKNINMNALVRTAKKYIGVKYKFNARPYPRSNRFDCSSYTQYVFAKHGVKLPRNARQQLRVGKTVSRKSLRKGDLLFFYVPGRFKSNKTAGHVGIYIGNGKMIQANSEPRNGVQIRSIKRAFWKKTFLRAKRVAY